jgi:hypothetical protein
MVDCERSVPRRCNFTPQETVLGAVWSVGWKGTRVSVHVMEKWTFLTLLGTRTATLLRPPVASRSTDCGGTRWGSPNRRGIFGFHIEGWRKTRKNRKAACASAEIRNEYSRLRVWRATACLSSVLHSSATCTRYQPFVLGVHCICSPTSW